MKLSDSLRPLHQGLLALLLLGGVAIGGLNTAHAGVPAAVLVSASGSNTLILLDLDTADFSPADIAQVESGFTALNEPATQELVVQLLLGLLGNLAGLPDLGEFIENVAVVFVPPSLITGPLGLPDAAAANAFVMQQGGFQALNLDVYVRAPVNRVTGPIGAPNIRLDLFLAIEDNGLPDPEEYAASIEVPEEFVELDL